MLNAFLIVFYGLFGMNYGTNDSYTMFPINKAILTSNHTDINGVNVTILKDIVVDNIHNQWYINVTDQIGYHMQIDLDDTWSFRQNEASMIKLTIDGNTDIIGNNFDLGLMVTFIDNNDEYLTVFNALDYKTSNAIFPSCTSDLQKINLALGDVKSYANSPSNFETSRKMKISQGNEWSFWNQKNKKMRQRNYWPLIITLTNDASLNDELNVSMTNPQWQQNEFSLNCKYNSFSTEQGLKMYLALNSTNEEINITSIKVEYFSDSTNVPTINPTIMPTTNIQTTTTSTTHNPTSMYSSTTNNPTLHPTLNPTIMPTTNNPTTNNPTTNNPTTNNPTTTSSTTNNEASNPTWYPTSMPTSNPTESIRLTSIYSMTTTSIKTTTGYINSVQVTHENVTKYYNETVERNEHSVSYTMTVIVAVSLFICITTMFILIIRLMQRKKAKTPNAKLSDYMSEELGQNQQISTSDSDTVERSEKELQIGYFHEEKDENEQDEDEDVLPTTKLKVTSTNLYSEGHIDPTINNVRNINKDTSFVVSSDSDSEQFENVHITMGGIPESMAMEECININADEIIVQDSNEMEFETKMFIQR